MTLLNKEEFELYYQEGIAAFESGQYRLSITKFEQAIKLIGNYSQAGGEAKMWLVNAYLAGGESEEAIALCEELVTHPHHQIRQKSVDLLYILKAPQLKRPKEWMTEIPDLNSASEIKPEYSHSSDKKSIQPKPQIELVDLSKVNTKDNKFIWLALILTLLTILGFFYLNSV